jgi:hypothetical protein
VTSEIIDPDPDQKYAFVFLVKTQKIFFFDFDDFYLNRKMKHSSIPIFGVVECRLMNFSKTKNE